MGDRGRGRGRGSGKGIGGEALRGGTPSRGGGYSRGSGRGLGPFGGRGGSIPQVFRASDDIVPVPDASADALETILVPTSGKAPLNLQKLSLTQDVPFRPGHGTCGVPITLWANYFQILPKLDVSLFRYAVDITPDVQNRRLKARIFQVFLEDGTISTLAPGIASDYQANIITNRKLTAPQLTSKITYRNEGELVALPGSKEYNVSLEETGVFTLADLIDYLTSSNVAAAFSDKSEIIQALNIVLNTFPKTKDPRMSLSTRTNVHFAVDGPFAQGYDLGASLQAWRGFFTSVRTAAARLLVNVQIKHGALYQSVRLDELMKGFREQNGNDPNKLNKFIRLVRVDRLHLKRAGTSSSSRPKSIIGIATIHDGRGLPKPPKVPNTGATARQVQFFLADNAPKPLKPNTYVTVFDYFNKVYNISANSQLPVVNIGTKEFPSYLPPEVCFVIPGQAASSKLSPDQTAQMIRFAVRRPFENAKSITETGFEIVGLTSTNPILAAFGIQVQPKMLTVKARILAAPGMRYAGNKVAQPRFGAWNMGSLAFSKGADLQEWSILWLQSPVAPDPWAKSPESLMVTLKAFHQTLNECGMRCATPMLPGKIIRVDEGNDELAIESGFKEIVSRNRKEKLLLVIIPRRDDRLYSFVKQCSDIKFGIRTVCVVASKFAKVNNVQYFANVALKFNLKLGGTNQALDAAGSGLISHGKTMVVGIDVTHPSPGSDKSAPSVAAMVASINKDLGQFPATLNAQTGRQEMVADLTGMLKSRLCLWQKHNTERLPENILVYRDGVSEGQYSVVLEKELPLLQQACREVYSPNVRQPAISIIIVGKRHNTRFYPTTTDKDKMDERSSNPRHGTVVDRGVTEPRNWDFFLQAHTALQGTARPAHYFVVHDEIFRRLPIPSGFTNASDLLENLTHNLCYMFGRATKAVSYCPPAYYADMVCERSRCYLTDLFSPTASHAGSASGALVTNEGGEPELASAR